MHLDANRFRLQAQNACKMLTTLNDNDDDDDDDDNDHENDAVAIIGL